VPRGLNLTEEMVNTMLFRLAAELSHLIGPNIFQHVLIALSQVNEVHWNAYKLLLSTISLNTISRAHRPSF